MELAIHEAVISAVALTSADNMFSQQKIVHLKGQSHENKPKKNVIIFDKSEVSTQIFVFAFMFKHLKMGCSCMASGSC
jgi:DNA polymerase III delta subunit